MGSLTLLRTLLLCIYAWRTSSVVSVPGRTVAQREATCAERDALSQAFTSRNTSVVFTKMYARSAENRDKTGFTPALTDIFENNCVKYTRPGASSLEIHSLEPCDDLDSDFHFQYFVNPHGNTELRSVGSNTCPYPLSFFSIGHFTVSTFCSTTEFCAAFEPCTITPLSQTDPAALNFAPVRCGCGTEVTPVQLSSTPVADRLGYQCEDWDECAEDHGCPPLSSCVNTVGSYTCQCDPGYHIEGDEGTTVGSYQDTCVLDGIPTTVVDTSFSTIRIKTSNSPAQIVHFRVTLGVWETPYKLVIPDRNAVKSVTRGEAESSSGVFYNMLQSGTEYTVTFVPLDASFQELPLASVGSATVRTTCSCDSSDGRPEDLEVVQQGGFVLFSFFDKSTCDEAFAFARRELTGDNTTEPAEDVFTANYYYFASGSSLCKNVPYKPGKAASDDLSISRLEVGNTYEYCVRGIAPRTSYSTEYTCEPHRIHWEASLDGIVKLTPEAGGLPVQNVFVRYVLYDAFSTPMRNGTIETEESGEFAIVFNEDLPSFTIRGQYRLHLVFSKLTSGLSHTFLCRRGSVDCTDKGTDVYLQHLRFNIPFEVIDDTSVPFSGIVVVANTSTGGMKGCPIAGAEVCLKDFAARGENVEQVCTNTDNTGRYSLPAVIGQRVSVSISYLNHSFAVLDPAKAEADATGVLIESDGIYEDNDYVDTQTTEIITEVAGGLCNRVLGDSKIRVTIANCPVWDGVLKEQSDYRATHVVPAHDLLVATEEVVGHLAATDAFQQLGAKRVDFTTVSATGANNLEDISSEPDAEEEEREMVRFQFNGTMQVGVRIRFELEQSCDAGVVDPSGIVNADTTSFHVVPLSTNLLIATISLSQFLGNGIEDCDHLDSDLPVTITNSLGLVSGAQHDDDYRIELAEKLDEDNLALMEVCNKGCKYAIIHDVLNNVTRNARALLPFRLTRPNTNAPYTKYLDVNIGGLYATTHRAVVVVTGRYDNGKLFSVGLPTYKPLLVLRDPPGGLSYAYYKNMRSVMRVEMKDFKAWSGVVRNADQSYFGEIIVEHCFGSGFGLVSMTCQEILDLKGRATTTDYSNDQFLGTLNHDEYGAEYTIDWSYETSQDVWLAGESSDAFLVPNLNVIFSSVDLISFDINTCTGQSNPETTFNLDSNDNEPAFTFYSRVAVEKQELPRLQSLSLEYQQRASNATTQAKITEFLQNKEAADDAYAAWTEFLDEYKATTTKINNGTYTKVAPHQWFDNWATGVNEGEHEPPRPKMWTGMVPKSLADRSEIRAVPWASPQSTSGREELENTHLIKFSGGGNLLKFEMKHDKAEKHISKLGSALDNSDFHRKSLLKLHGSLATFGFGIAHTAVDGLDVRLKHTYLRTDNTEDATRVGFVLGDGDAGDMFDVQVHFDPVYGTFAFNTTAGKSKCPYEKNTRRREAPKLQIFPPSAPVLSEDPMMFRLLITNEGEDISSFRLVVDHRSNPGILVPVINGDTLVMPQQYDRIEAGQTVSTSLSISRGPELYDYPPLRLAVESTCESVRNFGDGNLIALGDDLTKVFAEAANKDGRIVFTEPCHPISWAGELERDGKFVANSAMNTEALRVVIQNEGAFTFEESVSNSRLSKVELVYRQKNGISWITARGRPVGQTTFDLVDFAAVGLEDEFGFAQIEWEVPIFDGDYELAVRSVCDPSGEVELDSFITPVISGVVDRVRPELFGLPLPSFREVYSSDAFSFRFTEPIDCGKPYSFVIDVTFTGLSLRYETDELRVVCESEEGTVAFMLPSDAPMDQLLGQAINIDLSNVKDLAGNAIATSATLQSTYHSFNATADLVFFRLIVDTQCTTADTNQTHTVNGLVAELAQLLLVDASRIEISGIGCLIGGRLTAMVRIVPEEEASSTLRLRSLQSAESGLDLYRQLRDFNFSALSRSVFPFLANALIDPSTFEVVDESTGDVEPANEIVLNVPGGMMSSPQDGLAATTGGIVALGCLFGLTVAGAGLLKYREHVRNKVDSEEFVRNSISIPPDRQNGSQATHTTQGTQQSSAPATKHV